MGAVDGPVAARRREPRRERAGTDRGSETAGSPLEVAVRRLQRVAGNRAVGELLASPGVPLDAGARHPLEQFFGHDLSAVRVHTGAADAACDAVHADGFAIGDDVVMRSRDRAPSEASARRLLVHEVAHVVQQRQGPVDAEPGPVGVPTSAPNGPSERAAHRAASAFLARFG